MKKLLIAVMVAGMIMSFGSFGLAAPVTDVVEAPDYYFVPTDAQKSVSPYYRWHDQDWEWQHSVIDMTTATSATLSISAFDVDWTASDPEVDNIYVWDTSVAGWHLLGSLTGEDDTWSYTTFVLGSDFFDEIAAGLRVMIDIDSTHTYSYWAVTLAKSVLSVDGGKLPDPEPGVRVPEPATLLLLGMGFLGLGVLRRR